MKKHRRRTKPEEVLFPVNSDFSICRLVGDVKNGNVDN